MLYTDRISRFPTASSENYQSIAGQSDELAVKMGEPYLFNTDIFEKRLFRSDTKLSEL